MTGSPAGRVLALLERVQERPGLTAPELAAELGVSERTVRRYVATLQELEIPVEAGRGRYGGHRLRAGFRMPPLMLTTDEAVAITLALALAGTSDEPTPAQTALTKLQHVLPRGVSDRVHAVLDAVASPSAEGRRPGADPGPVAALAAGVVERRSCRVRHRGNDGTTTVREVNPYGLAVVRARATSMAGATSARLAVPSGSTASTASTLLTRSFRMPVGLDVVAAVERHSPWPARVVGVAAPACAARRGRGLVPLDTGGVRSRRRPTRPGSGRRPASLTTPSSGSATTHSP